MSKSEQAYLLLETMIEQGELSPESLVSESTLMELTGFGRTPIREAVQRLSRNHMLRIHPNKGIEIPRISVEDQLSRLEVRRAMETLAVRLACERASRAEIESMRRLAGSLAGQHSLAEYADTVRETHALVTAGAHNPYLAEAMAPLQGMSRRFWLTHVTDEQKEIAEGSELHTALLQSIIDRDKERAHDASIALNDYLVESALAVVLNRSV